MSFVWKKVRILAPENEATTKYVQVHCVPVRNVCACTSMYTSLLCSVYIVVLTVEIVSLRFHYVDFHHLRLCKYHFHSASVDSQHCIFVMFFICFCVHHCTASRVRKKLLWQSDLIYFQFQFIVMSCRAKEPCILFCHLLFKITRIIIKIGASGMRLKGTR